MAFTESELEAKINMEKCIQETGKFMFDNKMTRNDEQTLLLLELHSN